MSIPICSNHGYINVLSLPNYTLIKNISTTNLALTGGFKKDENNYILYGISSNKIYILNINGENISQNEVELYNYPSTFILNSRT